MTNPFNSIAQDYDQWFDDHPNAYQSELAAIKALIPAGKQGAEIGVGTGRFAAVLGITDGVEPAPNMATMARKRGIRVEEATAEDLPYPDASFDFLLMVTVDCFLTDVATAYEEAHRVLRPGGNLIIGMLDKEGPIARKYEQVKVDSPIYSQAEFHSVENTLSMLTHAGFHHFAIQQTLTELDPEKTEPPQRGYGAGGFVVIKAQKHKGFPLPTSRKSYTASSVFKPENLLREARRQRGIENCDIPDICVLDPDGDIVEYLVKAGKAKLNACWACYHTKMYEFSLGGKTIGIIGCAVGASFAVLLAEQMFVSGCQLLISITSAGIINPPPSDARFLLIEEALRDEGTSFHYLPPEKKTTINSSLLRQLSPLMSNKVMKIVTGKSWTTDAPYRETEAAIELAKAQGVNAVEMEAAALYAFATYRQVPIVCFAHLTNTMAQEGDDFEKGAENGSIESLQLIEQTIKCYNK